MLSAHSKEVIAATLPAVGAAIDEITSLFYRKLFAAHPELERDLFNRGNQKQGEQQKALAGAVAGFAILQLDPDPERGRQLLGRIAHKHASLGVTADQYEIVHTHLFEAIVDVLGDAVTPDVAAAWDELYWLMAETLIALEKELYTDVGVTAGDVWRRVVVRERRNETADSVSFTVTSADGTRLPGFVPGQYVSVGVHLADGARQIRQYSLCSATSAGDWKVTVKRIDAQLASDGSVVPTGEVSNFLYENVFEGDVLDVTTPFGDVVLPDDDAPLLLISAGIGCTPVMGMLSHLVATGDQRRIAVLHADRSASAHAHREHLNELVAALPNAVMHRWYEDMGVRQSTAEIRSGRVDLDDIDIAADTQVYLCGPLPFMHGIRAALLAKGVPGARIHYEIFGPDTWAPVAA
ncbi:MAG: nitric oxide dioxygenase [Mycobacterium sp.]|jgi:nitric oxide dioxygenase|nr:nitric oxide dioxygenase [Mycobacterium sp.]